MISLRWNRAFRCGALALAALLTSCTGEDTSSETSEPPTTTTTVAPTTTSVELEVETTTTSLPPLLDDFGVSDTAIRLGYSLDLTGPYSEHDLLVRDVTTAYFEQVNADGGIDGRDVELTVLDNGFDVPTHLDNLSQLADASTSGVLAIGDLSHPLFGDASVSVLNEADILAVAELEPAEPAGGATRVVAIAGSVCQQAKAGLAAVASSAEQASRLAIISNREAWAIASATSARDSADGLGLEIVTDLAGFDDLAEVSSVLLGVQSDVVWLAVSPNELVQLSTLLGGLDSVPLWVGASPTFDRSVLGDDVPPELADVYLHVSALGELEAATAERRELSELIPRLTYAEGTTALAALRQAKLLHRSIEDAIDARDLTRAGLARLAAMRADRSSRVELYRLAPDAATSSALDDESGGRGLELADEFVVSAEASACN